MPRLRSAAHVWIHCLGLWSILGWNTNRLFRDGFFILLHILLHRSMLHISDGWFALQPNSSKTCSQPFKVEWKRRRRSIKSIQVHRPVHQRDYSIFRQRSLSDSSYKCIRLRYCHDCSRYIPVYQPWERLRGIKNIHWDMYNNIDTGVHPNFLLFRVVAQQIWSFPNDIRRRIDVRNTLDDLYSAASPIPSIHLPNTGCPIDTRF